MRKIKQTDRPYIIRYIRGARTLYDSAENLDQACARIAFRSTKKASKGEVAEVYRLGKIVFSTAGAS